MCYINGVRVTHAEFIEYKNQERALRELTKLFQFREVRRGFDYTDWPIIKPSTDGKSWDLVTMEWGFLPSHLKNREEVDRFRNGYVDASGKYQKPITTLNAIGEELLIKPMYKEAALERRCLVISTEFYEHRHIPVMGKRGKILAMPEKFPYVITIKDRKYFFIPAIWNNWTDRDTGENVDTFAICTTKANGYMRQVHNSKERMPTIPPIEMAEEWTEKDLSPKRIIEIASYQIRSKEMEAHLVPKNFLDLDDPTVMCDDPRVPGLIYD